MRFLLTKKNKKMKEIIFLYKKGLSEKEIRQELELKGFSKKEIKKAFNEFFSTFKTVKEVFNN